MGRAFSDESGLIIVMLFSAVGERVFSYIAVQVVA
jgi:hypothetical protein